MKGHLDDCTYSDNACKFSEAGCKFFGYPAPRQAHEASCLFQMIECPWGPCLKMIPLGEAVDHLKIAHKNAVYKANRVGSAKVLHMHWFPCDWIELDKVGHCQSPLATFDDCTVLLNAYSNSRTWEFWVTHLGGDEQAQKYEVKIGASQEGSPTSILFQGKVYGTQKKVKICSEKDKDGVLELSKSLMKKIGFMHEGNLAIPMSFELVRK